MKELSFKQNLLWNSVGSFTYLFSQWLFTLLVVRLSSDFENAGNLALAISVTNIFYNMACFNVRPYLVSDFSNKFRVEDYVSFRLVTCILATAMCFLYILFFQYTQSQLICIMLYMVFKIGEAVVDLLHAFEQRKGRMDIGGFSLFCRGILLTISFFIGMKLYDNVNIAIIFMIISTWVFIILFDFNKVKHFEKISWHFKRDKIIQLFYNFLPLTIGAFIGTTTAALPRQFLEGISGSEALGIYGTIATPAVIVQVASSYIYNPMIVHFGRLREKSDKKGFQKLFVKTAFIILGVSIICIIGSIYLAEWGLTLLYGAEIGGYAYLFLPVIIFTTLNGFQWFCSNLLIVFRRMKAILFINISGFIVCIASSTFMIEKFGLNGVSYVMIFFTSVTLIEMVMLIFTSIHKLSPKSN